MSHQSSINSTTAIESTNGLQQTQPVYHLPQPLTAFLGRVQEKAAIQQLITTARLITLSGVGGSGKTRLALAVVHALINAANTPFPDGIGWVELAPLADATLAPQAVLSTFGWREEAGRTPIEVLIDGCATKTMLLVLDNCEHLAAACATLVETLLRACPHLRIVTTSREPLGVEGEAVWLTPPLAPDEAVNLFLARATTAVAGFTLSAQNSAIVVHLCQQLAGLPLAIELAAARLPVLSVEQIAARLTDALPLLASHSRTLPPRQRTMHATLDWSYTLLTPAEQTLFARLAVFAGGFTLAAVEVVCTGGGLATNTMLDLITQLAHKSLLVVEQQADAARYRYLEPVRQYAVQKLYERGEETHWRRAHVAWCVALAEESERAIETRDQVYWLQRLERELANLRAAFAWSEQNDACQGLGLRLAVTLLPFWNKQNRRSEGRRWLDHFNTAETLPIGLRARAFFCSGQMAYNQLDLTAAIAYYHAGIALCRTAHLPQEEAQAWQGIGNTHLLLDEPAEAATAFQASLTVAKASNVPAEIVIALRGLGRTAQNRQDYEQARTYYEMALACAQTNANDFLTGYLLENLGYLYLIQDDYPTARNYYLAFLALMQQKGGSDREAQALICLAAVAFKEGNTAQAQQLYGESLALQRAVHKPQRMVAVLNHLATLAQQQGDLQAAQRYYSEALAEREGVRKTDVIVTLTGLGDLALAAGAPSQARDHYSEALALALTLHGLVPASFDPAMPMALSQPLPAQVWIAAVQEKLASLFTHSTNSQAGVPMPLEDLLKSAKQATGRSVTVNPQGMPVPDPLDKHPIDRPVLQLYALGPLRVCVAERELTAADWVYARAKEVLLYLLLQPSATREQIALEFWPDASPEQVRSRFSAVLTHARKALGHDFDWLPFADGRYTFNRTGPYWFDVEAFETKLRLAHNHLRHTPRQVPAAIACLESAIALYQGDLGADLKEGEWYQGKREQLRQAFANALLMLGRLHVEAERYDLAADFYRRGVTHDRYREEAHRELMRCLARQGEPALALRHYETLACILAELDVSPSPETEALVVRLRRGERI